MTRRHADVPRTTTHFGRMKDASPSHAMTRPYTRPGVVEGYIEDAAIQRGIRQLADKIEADSLERYRRFLAEYRLRQAKRIACAPLPTTPKGGPHDA